MKQLIILEGPDAAGKSYLGNFIAGYCNGVLFHCNYTEPLGHAMTDYQLNVLDNALVGIGRGQTWIIDRHWPSEVVYSKIYRPNMHGNALQLAERAHALITSVDCLYVYCCDSDVAVRHEMEPDPNHHYDKESFLKVVDAYDRWFEGMHEDYVATYNLLVHGGDIPQWIKENLS